MYRNTQQTHAPRFTATTIAAILSTPMLFAISCSESPSDSVPQSMAASTPTVSLEMAIIQGDAHIVQEHIRAGTPINTPNFTGDTPLSIAAVMGRTSVAKLLIEADAELETKNQAGTTPLFNAAFFCHPDILQLLIDAGAEKETTDASGTPIVQIMQTPWSQIEPVYASIYASIGMPFEAERIESTRSQIVTMLR